MTENEPPDSSEPPAPAPPAFGQPPYGQSSYAHQQYGFGQPYAPYAAPNHPQATTALALGLVSTIGAFLCLLPAIAGPFAIVISLKARRQIRQSQGQVGGDGMATAGLVLGIIGTVLLALMVLAVVALLILAFAYPSSFHDGSGTTV